MPDINERYDERISGLSPSNALSPPRFGEIRQTIAELVTTYLRTALTRATWPAQQLVELPGLREWVTYSSQSHNTAAVTVAKWTDTTEDLPRIVVSVPRDAELMYLGGHRLAAGWRAPSISTATAGPWALEAGDQLILRIRTQREVASAAGNRVSGGDLPDYGYVTCTVTLGSTDTADLTEVTADELAALINREAQPYVGARSDATGLTILADGPGPGWIEVAGGAIAEALDWGRGGNLGAIASTPTPLTLDLSAGAAASAGDVGRYVTLSGTRRSSRNDGRWLISAAPTATTVVASRRFGAVEAAGDATWWIGEFASTEAVAPIIRRAKLSTCDIEVKCLTNSFKGTQGLSDAVYTLLTILADRNRQALVGLGLDPNIVEGLRPDSPNQRGMLTLNGNISVGSDTKTSRMSDPENGVHEAVITLQGSYGDYIDREARLVTTYTRLT